MRLIVLFEDTADMVEHRKQNVHLHVEYVEQNHVEILIAGGLREDPEGNFVGGLWILEVESFDRAHELVLNDPYYRKELRDYTIRFWGKAGDRPAVL